METDAPVILKSLLNAQIIQKKIEISEQSYLSGQARMPEIAQQLNKAEKIIERLCESKEPLYKTKPVIARLELECARLRTELHKYSDTSLLERFKKSSLQGSHFINESVKRHHEPVAFESTASIEEIVAKRPKTIATAWVHSNHLDELETLDLDEKDEEEEEEEIEPEEEPESQRNIDEKRWNEIQSNLLNIKRLHLVDDEIAMAASAAAAKPGAIGVKPFCKTCGLPMFCAANQSNLVCKKCSILQDYDDSQTLQMAFNISSDLQHNGYTHLMNIIEPFRSRKRLVIPIHVFDSMRGLIRQNRFRLNRQLTFPKTQTYLEYLNLKDLYEHKHQITMEMNGELWPIMTEQQEWIIVRTFLMIQAAFEKAKNARSVFDSKKTKRSSFLKYEFVTYHICRMLGFHLFCPYLKLLQVPARHRKQLKMLRLICKDLGWPYQPQLW